MPPVSTADPSRNQSLDAAAEVFARQGYDGTKIERPASRRRMALQPLIDTAVVDGTVAPDVDPEAVVFIVRTMHLGLLLRRGAGLSSPDSSSWDALINRIVASFGDPSSGDITK